jgi:hypothetical protein
VRDSLLRVVNIPCIVVVHKYTMEDFPVFEVWSVTNHDVWVILIISEDKQISQLFAFADDIYFL